MPILYHGTRAAGTGAGVRRPPRHQPCRRKNTARLACAHARHGGTAGTRLRRAAGDNGDPPQAAGLTSIFRVGFRASSVFGNVIVRTPFASSAAILSRSIPSGSAKARRNEP